MTTTEAKAPRTAESLLRKIEAMPSEAYKIKAIADALREAAAAPPEPPRPEHPAEGLPLDVERLAMAMCAVNAPDGGPCQGHKRSAAIYAAEYARLSASSGESE